MKAKEHQKGRYLMESRDKMLEGKKILIVDDEPDVLDTLEDLLSMCEVVKASSFEEAVKQLESGPFDFVILDIMGVNGYALLDMAREKKLTALMLTAHALSPMDTVRSFRGGRPPMCRKTRFLIFPIFWSTSWKQGKRGPAFGGGGWKEWKLTTRRNSARTGKIRTRSSGTASPIMHKGCRAKGARAAKERLQDQ
jgi:CheY-like chemotaxis protein